MELLASKLDFNPLKIKSLALIVLQPFLAPTFHHELTFHFCSYCFELGYILTLGSYRALLRVSKKERGFSGY
jgi:hypothetical protein